MNNIRELQALVTRGETDWKKYGEVNATYKDGLVIFNYTTQAQYDARWNWFERVSRGLILNTQTGEVVARPFDKFFNWGEGGRCTDARLVEVTEKLDGSLGILYRHNGEYRIATRGSFGSEQASWATEFFKRHHLPRVSRLSAFNEVAGEATLLFEIIYPENRVVVDYGSLSDLVLVGIRDRVSGHDYFYEDVRRTASLLGFATARTFSFQSPEDTLVAAKELGVDREGWVLRFADGQRFKVKGEAYKQVHRLLYQATPKRVLQAIASDTLGELIDGIPDEFLGDIQRWQADIEASREELHRRVVTAWEQAPKSTRKEMALWLKKHHPDVMSGVFALADGKDGVLNQWLFRQIEQNGLPEIAGRALDIE